MDSVWLLIALFFGLAAQQIRLPPLVGFLVAGFVLNALGEEGGELLELASDYGIYLLLFTIGLKLRLKEFADPAIGGGATAHMALITLLAGAGFLLLAALGMGLLSPDDYGGAAVIAFGFSFSSTVFAVKVFEERGESRARHAVIAIGILIIQDIIAVLFLVFAQGKVPTIWALGLLALPLFRPVLFRILEKSGHGEVLVLFGLASTAFAAELFYAVGMKPDIGVLVFGILLGGHKNPSSSIKHCSASRSFSCSGFFLSIGLIASADARKPRLCCGAVDTPVAGQDLPVFLVADPFSCACAHRVSVGAEPGVLQRVRSHRCAGRRRRRVNSRELAGGDGDSRCRQFRSSCHGQHAGA